MSEPQVVEPASPPADFPQFARLPTELRLIIWEMAVEEPRNVFLFAFPAYRTPRTLTVGEDNFYDAPEFFFVNQECRAVATKVYTDISIMLQDTTSKHITISMKVKRGDGFWVWCDHFGCSAWCGELVEDEDSKAAAGSVNPQYQPEIMHCHDFCSINKMRDWLSSIWSDGRISEDSLEPWRSFEESNRYITISLRHPFLNLKK
ncbi:hypothetical protein F4680DRAFT_447633 [Xylaria scruposa]|nr:hypothetical protein F4680DRAFT_447633 [Xylaria scruposa]